MDAATISVSSTPGQRLTPRTLGTLGIVGSPMMLVEGIRVGFGPSTMDFWSGLGGLLYVGGWAASLAGLRLLRATGDGAWARALFLLQMTGLALAAYWTAQYILPGPVDQRSIVWRVTDIAWPLSHLLMLVLGVTMVAAGRFRGWRKYPALLCGLALPTFVALTMAGAPGLVAGASFPLMTAAGFLLLGLAVRTGADAWPRALDSIASSVSRR